MNLDQTAHLSAYNVCCIYCIQVHFRLDIFMEQSDLGLYCLQYGHTFAICML